MTQASVFYRHIQSNGFSHPSVFEEKTPVNPSYLLQNLLQLFGLFSDAESMQLDLLFNETQKLPYIWAKDKPLLYVQQIIMKIG